MDQWIELTSEPAHFLLVRIEHDRRFCLTFVQIRHYRRASQSVDLAASPVSTSPQILDERGIQALHLVECQDRQSTGENYATYISTSCIINLVLHIYQLHNQCFGKRMIFPRATAGAHVLPLAMPPTTSKNPETKRVPRVSAWASLQIACRSRRGRDKYRVLFYFRD